MSCSVRDERGSCFFRGCLVLSLALSVLGCTGRSNETDSVVSARGKLIVDGVSFANTQNASAFGQAAAASVAALIDSSVVNPPSGSTPGTIITRNSDYCTGQPFATEQRFGGDHECSAFFIGGDKFLTAGHCIAPPGVSVPANLGHLDCAGGGAAVVLGWTVDGSNPNGNPSVPADRFYSCAAVVSHGGLMPPELNLPACGPGAPIWPKCSREDPRFDWAVLRVDRAVTAPVTGFAIGTPYEIRAGQTTTVIGYPGGLPQKIDESARVRVPKPLELFSWFEFDADISRGNSGGPVLDRVTNIALGIVSTFPDNQDLDQFAGLCRNHTTCTAGSGVCANGSQATSAWNAFFPPFPNDPGPRPDPIDFESGMSFAIVGDWNGNSTTDALVFVRQASVLLVGVVADGTQTFIPLGILPASGSLPLVAAGDFTGDSLADVVIAADGLSYFLSSADILGFFNSPDATRSFAPSSSLGFLAAGFVSLVSDDVNGDATADIRALSATGAETDFCGSSSGLTTTCAGAGVRIDIEGDGDLDVVQLFRGSGDLVNWRTRRNPTGTVTNATTAPYAEPIIAVAGNFNGDVNASTGLPQREVAFLSGGTPFYLLSMGTSGTGGMVGRPLDGRADYVKLRVDDANQDGIDDIEAVRADGSVRVFLGRPGFADAGGPSTQGIDYEGMPSADPGDGRFMVTSGGRGTDLDHYSMLVQLPSSTSNVSLQIFDGDYGGVYDDFDAAEAFACYALHAAPDGTPPDNPTVGALFIRNETDFDDGVWNDVLTGPPHAEARLGSGQPYFYRLEVYFSSTSACDDVVGEPDATNSIKLRSNGAVIWDTGDLELMPRDLRGDFGGGVFASTIDTDYDGTWDFLVDVGDAVSGEIQLLDRDADRADATIPGSPPQPGLFYDLAPIDPEADFIYTVESPDGPSGNFPDEETLIFDTFGIAEPTRSFGGLWLWHWGNLRAGNDLHIGIRASPARYAATGSRVRRLSPSASRAAEVWRGDSAGLAAGLPIVIGHGAGTVAVTTPAAAVGILGLANGTPLEQLRAELLATKLNLGRARAIGENLPEAHFYGSETIVKDQIAAADELLRQGSAANATVVASATRLLRAGNRGNVSYVPVEVPSPPAPDADPDGDGVDNVHDNCPPVANATQTDGDRNGIGDACDPAPFAECALPRGGGRFTAVFGYHNPFRERVIRGAPANTLTGAVAGAVPPALFRRGEQRRALVVDSAGTPIVWNVLGKTATASLSSPQCSGDDLITLGFPADVVVYGKRELKLADRVNIADCSTSFSRGPIDIGVEARVGEVVTIGSAVLRDRAAVCGVVRANGTITAGNGVTSAGLLSGQANTVPSLDWSVTFPPPSRDVFLAPDATGTLAPGSYGQVTVSSRATLSLSAGSYFFTRLTVEPQGRLVANESGGPVTLHVRTSLVWRGDILQTGGTGLLVGYFGTADVVVERAFAGTLIAPSARVTLASITSPGFVGRFFADRLEARPDALIRR